MKKINFKRVTIAVIVGGGFFLALMFGSWHWLMSPNFPYPWISDETWCAQETAKQPYISQEHYLYFFENCLNQKEKGG